MSKQIVVTGDVAIDHLYLSFPPDETDQNWSFFPNYETFLLPGGAFLLAEFTRHAVKALLVDAVFAAPKPPENLAGTDGAGLVQAKILLDKYGDNKDNKKSPPRLNQGRQANRYNSAGESKDPTDAKNLR